MAPVFDSPITTNDLSIDRVLSAGLPVVLVILDGSASPALEQALSQAARTHAGNLLVAKLHAKDNPASVQRFQVKSLPALVSLKDGQAEARAEAVTGGEVEAHALYLLGRGPRPQPAATGASSSASAASSRPGAAQSQPGARSGAARRPVEVTDASFDQIVMRSDRPVLVDFWAPWCGPCRMTEPVLEKLAHELGERLLVAKVNVDQNPVLSQRFAVQSIPTMMVFKGGRSVDRWMGALPEPALRSKVAAHI